MMKNEIIKKHDIIEFDKENFSQSAMLQTLRLIFFVKFQTHLNLRLSCLLDNVKGLDKKNGLKRIGKNETGLISLSPF